MNYRYFFCDLVTGSTAPGQHTPGGGETDPRPPGRVRCESSAKIKKVLTISVIRVIVKTEKEETPCKETTL